MQIFFAEYTGMYDIARAKSPKSLWRKPSQVSRGGSIHAKLCISKHEVPN